MDPEQLPPGWHIWNAEPDGRLILAYRPDVFDSSAFPAPCLPTIVVAPGSSPDDPPARRETSDRWHVALYLEPTVRVRTVDAAFDTRREAVRSAVGIADRFAAGAIDYRSIYQVPREAYLDELDRLIRDD